MRRRGIDKTQVERSSLESRFAEYLIFAEKHKIVLQGGARPTNIRGCVLNSVSCILCPVFFFCLFSFYFYSSYVRIVQPVRFVLPVRFVRKFVIPARGSPPAKAGAGISVNLSFRSLERRRIRGFVSRNRKTGNILSLCPLCPLWLKNSVPKSTIYKHILFSYIYPHCLFETFRFPAGKGYCNGRKKRR